MDKHVIIRLIADLACSNRVNITFYAPVLYNKESAFWREEEIERFKKGKKEERQCGGKSMGRARGAFSPCRESHEKAREIHTETRRKKGKLSQSDSHIYECCTLYVVVLTRPKGHNTNTSVIESMFLRAYN